MELTYELLSDQIVQTSSGRVSTEDQKPVKGADGQLACITLKFKPFIFEIGEDPGYLASMCDVFVIEDSHTMNNHST